MNLRAICMALLFFSHFSTAQNCPELTGEYICAEGSPRPYRLDVRQSFGWDTTYDFFSGSDGRRQIVANGFPQDLETPMGEGTSTAHCWGNQLLITFRIRTKDGRNYAVEDTIRKEGKTLVRIRISLPESQIKAREVSACRSERR